MRSFDLSGMVAKCISAMTRGLAEAEEFQTLKLPSLAREDGEGHCAFGDRVMKFRQELKRAFADTRGEVVAKWQPGRSGVLPYYAGSGGFVLGGEKTKDGPRPDVYEFSLKIPSEDLIPVTRLRNRLGYCPNQS